MSNSCDKCQSAFLRILRNSDDYNFNKNTKIDRLDFIRDVMNTEKCDKFHNLSDFRKEYIDIITKDGVDRIMNFYDDISDYDYHRAGYSIKHNEYYTKIQVKKALSWPNYIKYIFSKL